MKKDDQIFPDEIRIVLGDNINIVEIIQLICVIEMIRGVEKVIPIDMEGEIIDNIYMLL